ncbi:MAG: hypothetical protein J7L34_05245, partial [Thermotogaceae bacterium]|nr:hypothetical protein [Thermotogaceae bacterium]
IKDIRGEFEKIGKDLRKDVNKKTIVKLKGLKEAEKEAEEIFSSILNKLNFYKLNNTVEFLVSIKNLMKEG